MGTPLWPPVDSIHRSDRAGMAAIKGFLVAEALGAAAVRALAASVPMLGVAFVSDRIGLALLRGDNKIELLDNLIYDRNRRQRLCWRMEALCALHGVGLVAFQFPNGQQHYRDLKAAAIIRSLAHPSSAICRRPLLRLSDLAPDEGCPRVLTLKPASRATEPGIQVSGLPCVIWHGESLGATVSDADRAAAAAADVPAVPDSAPSPDASGTAAVSSAIDVDAMRAFNSWVGRGPIGKEDRRSSQSIAAQNVAAVTAAQIRAWAVR
eukprot:c48233_g1_i1.p1 GENE.c48233_g1_i1~~c48233_g1_i1.p1  ORF type:complete len:265 (-),score=6.12 c48233_g1_i1:235-1029(-)